MPFFVLNFSFFYYETDLPAINHGVSHNGRGLQRDNPIFFRIAIISEILLEKSFIDIIGKVEYFTVLIMTFVFVFRILTDSR